MRQLETRLAGLEGRTPRIVWERESARPDTSALATPARTAQVAQILVDAGALRITADGEVLTRTSGGDWAPYRPTRAWAP